MTLTSRWRAVVAAAFLLTLSACGGGGDAPSLFRSTASFSGATVQEWFDLQLELVKQTPGFSPPVASRAFGYTGVALYEATRGGVEGSQSLAGALNGLATPPQSNPNLEYHWEAAANAALAQMSRFLYPGASAALRNSMDQLEASKEAAFRMDTDGAVIDRSIAHGRAVATWISDWSRNDGAHYGYLTNTSPGYVAPVGPGLWVPTPPAFAPALQAAWGTNRTFVLENGNSCQPGPPPPYSTVVGSDFRNEAEEVYQTVNALTPEQLAIAQYWSDDPGTTATPPGHWVSILNQLVVRDDLKLDVCAEAYGRLGIAVADAFISCWWAKFEHSLVRPITYIRNEIDANWTSPVGTPPFPEYTSGHSVQSGAAAEVLTALFGQNFAFTDDTHAGLGYPARSFSSFYEAADEAAISRLYGGIHYRSAIDLGVDQGRAIGRIVSALPMSRGPQAPPTGTPATAHSGDVAMDWFDLQLDLVRTTPGFTPPVASRAFAYTGIALHEAVRPGVPGGRTLAGQLNELTTLPAPVPGATYHWPTVANAALATTSRFFFRSTSAANLASIDALEQAKRTLYASSATTAVLDRSVAFGQEVAEAVIFYSRDDGGQRGYETNFPASYVPPVGPGLWVPTPPMMQSALQPYWGQNRTFALVDGGMCPPGPPPPYSTDPMSTFYAEALEVYDTVNNITPEQLAIAEWWADDPGATATPPGHSISMCTIILREGNFTLDRAAEAYGRVGIAIADAFIGCWNSKYNYNLLRPITYIQAEIDANWSPPVSTPPFPEYTSGHSVQSGAWAEVMTAMFGSAVSFTDTTNTFLGQPARQFSSFYEAADEAALSRLYGGIHYDAAIRIGVQQGRCIGQETNALIFRD